MKAQCLACNKEVKIPDGQEQAACPECHSGEYLLKEGQKLEMGMMVTILECSKYPFLVGAVGQVVAIKEDLKHPVVVVVTAEIDGSGPLHGAKLLFQGLVGFRAEELEVKV